MRLSYLQSILAIGGFATTAVADWQFHSRPELAVPKLNITVAADRGRVDNGFIFVAPYHGFFPGSTGPTQPGAYIYRDDGELVWAGTGFHAGWVANFRPVTWKGKQYLRAFQGTLDGVRGRMYGFLTLLGSNYELAKKVHIPNHGLVSAHEFRVVNGKTALIEFPIPRPVSLKPWGGKDDQKWIASASFQEVDIETGELIFSWESFPRVDPKLSAFPLSFGQGIPGSGKNETDAWNYFFINSVDKDDEGNYLLSARNMAAVFKINGTSGDVIWQLGGFHGGSNFELSDEDRFAFQHHARFRGRSEDGNIEIISLFDNGAHSAPIEKTHPSSRARVYELDHNKGRARALRTFEAPDGLSAPTQGSVQILPNKNVFVNWGQAGAVTEFSNSGEVLFHSYLDSAPHGHFVQSYRGWRYNWTGTPAEEPAIVASPSGVSGKIDIYASWNGDTETAVWKFYNQLGDLIGEAKRNGFETHASFHSAIKTSDLKIFAEAFDSHGRSLVRTKAVRVASTAAYPDVAPGMASQWTVDEL